MKVLFSDPFIRSLKPALVFLDIEMPVMNGFQLLEELGDFSFALIFSTAYDRFAVKAFRYSAVDYLLKPVNPEELRKAVDKAAEKQRVEKAQLDLLRQQLYHQRNSIAVFLYQTDIQRFGKHLGFYRKKSKARFSCY